MKLPTWHGEGTREKAWQGALSGYGARLMAGMGWREGQGLGKDAQGIARCLEEKRKATPAGVGAPRADFNAGGAWWERAFDSAARRMNAGGSPQPSSSSSSGSSSSSDSSDTAAGGAATKVGGAAAAARHRDGMVSTMTAEEMALAERLAKASGRAPAGRFGGREGKLARVRRQEQALAARADEALGARLAGALNPAAAEGAGQGKRKREPAAAAAPAKRVVREVRLAEEPERAPYRPTFGDGWWGLKRFAFGGLLEGRAEKTRTFENGFRAEDQERLYRQAHFKKTVGKGGLGAGALGLPAKNLGNAWKGSKTTFGGGAAGEGAADGEKPPEKKEKKKKGKEKGKERAGKKKAKKAKKATAPGPAGSRGSAGGLEEAAVVRACQGLWEKKGKGGKVDLAVVVKALRKQFSLDKATAAAEVAAVLKASKRFKVKGAAGKERVKLRGGRGEG